MIRVTLTIASDSIPRIVYYAGTLEATRRIRAYSIRITVVCSSRTLINFCKVKFGSQSANMLRKEQEMCIA